MAEHYQISSNIWQIALLLGGLYRPSEYGRVILPMTVLRRLDCIIAPINVAKQQEKLKQAGAFEPILNKSTEYNFYNTSPWNFETLRACQNNLRENLVSYIEGFPKNIREIFDRFEFKNEINKMHQANILNLILFKFSYVDLYLDNITMGALFEDLIYRSYKSNSEYFTPREITSLMIDILFNPDNDFLTKSEVIRILDPICGTSIMLSQIQSYLSKHNLNIQLKMYGQDANLKSCAIAASNMLMRGVDSGNIRCGDSLTADKYKHEHFDYLIAYPPFSLSWKKQQKQVQYEHKKQGFAGRFGAGLPRVNDASLLFLQHMMSKFEPYNPEQGKNGSRLGIIFNGSPLLNGGASSGESEIRKWIIENDWLEAIIALPKHIFYKSSSAYILILTNRKIEKRKGKIQLIDARNSWQPMLRSSRNKGCYLSDDIRAIVDNYSNFVRSETSKIFLNEEFGYNQIYIERPLRLVYQMSTERKSRFFDAAPHLLDDVQAIDREFGREARFNWSEFDKLMKDLLKQRDSKWKKYEYNLFRDVFTERNPNAKPVILKERKATDDPAARVWGWHYDDKSKIERMYELDIQLRDFENVGFVDKDQRSNEKAIIDHFYTNVEPYIPDAWVNREKIRCGYKIDFNQYFYKSTPLRSLAEIDTDLKCMEQEIIRLMREVIK